MPTALVLQMAAARPVGIHVRDDVEGRPGEQPAGDRIGLVEQPLERALHPPFGHRLAGMLAGVEPDLERPVADPEIIHLLPVESLPERAVLDQRMGRDRGDEVVMALHRVGREIGEPDAVRRRSHPDGEDSAFIGRVDPLPLLAVERHAGAVILPAERIGGAGAVEDPELDRLAGRAGQAEIEPLVEIGSVVLGDFEVDSVALDGDRANVAAIEGARNG